MEQTLPLSVHVLTLNSGRTLARALESVKGAAEILVVDGGSTDDTLDIAKRHGARIIPQNDRMEGVTDFARIRNITLEAATQPWIFILDSDEYASPELFAEITNIASSTEPVAFLVPRKYVLNGTVIEHASTYPNERIYFFHRDAVIGWIKPVHERVRVKSGIPITRLKNPCLAPLPPLREWKEKNERYVRIEAGASRGQGWLHWFKRILHTLRSRLIAAIRIFFIWLLPHQGKRLPLAYEWARFAYGWRLIVETCPFKR
ncbi:MAG: family 2 glycosyl transferase [Candidatus Peregrinibacteria bacterium Greene0416_19]|nr:MAG: family 2 glycosyl transferase [Candidatus Peregrinibacteria bacterium Greene0416_19]